MRLGAKEQETSVLALHHRYLSLALAATLAVTASDGARAQGKLDAEYRVSLAGIPIGKGTWALDIGDVRYTATASGTATGLMRVLTGGHGTTNVSGTFNASQPFTSLYASTIATRHKTDNIRFVVDNGSIEDLKFDPPQKADSSRVPVTEAHLHGVIDPITAALVRMPGTGDPISAEACRRGVSIFDGRMRYDLKLAFKRFEQVKADKGYAGPVVVCAVNFTPIAGYVPHRAAIRYIASQQDIEVWLAPIAGTRVLVPFRAQSPTPIGPVVFEATRFVALAVPKTQ
jgi:hypothetical protein